MALEVQALEAHPSLWHFSLCNKRGVHAWAHTHIYADAMGKFSLIKQH